MSENPHTKKTVDIPRTDLFPIGNKHEEISRILLEERDKRKASYEKVSLEFRALTPEQKMSAQGHELSKKMERLVHQIGALHDKIAQTHALEKDELTNFLASLEENS